MKNNTDAAADKSTEEAVRTFYDTFGWVEVDGKKSGEDISSREYRAPYYRYHEGAIERTLKCFSNRTGRLLIAGGGDMPESHVAIASQFANCCCLDISQKALEIAKNKLGAGAEYVLGSILEMPMEGNTFDAVLCAHVIFHIDARLQEKAVDELIRVTKPGGRIVIIYSNPGSIVAKAERGVRFMNRLRSRVTRSRKAPVARTGVPAADGQTPCLPFAIYPLKWWKRFDLKCKVTILPWEVMGNYQEQILVRSDWFAKVVYRCCSWVEKTMPGVAARWWQYPLIIMDKPQEDHRRP